MQHLQYGMKSLSEFAIALRWLLLRSILRHIILLVPSFTPPHHIFPLVSACISDLVLAVDYARIISIVLYCIELHCIVFETVSWASERASSL